MITENTPQLDTNMVSIPKELMDCVFLFIHQVDINDYTTLDGQHTLKMNAFWPAMKSFHDLAIRGGVNPNDPELHNQVMAENNARLKYLPPTIKAFLNEQQLQDKEWIDKQSYEGLLQLRRTAPCGHRMFMHGPIADYYDERMAYLRNLETDNGVGASKRVGWD